MFCSSCGKKNSDQVSFCYSCGQQLSARDQSPPPASPRSRRIPSQVIAPPAVVRTRPGLVTLLAVLQFIGAGLTASIAAILAVVSVSIRNPDTKLSVVVIATIFGSACVVAIIGGIGLLRLRRWARLLHMALAWIGLLAFPVGTVVSILILVYMFKPGVKLLFSDVDFDHLAPSEAAQVSAVIDSSAATTAAVIVLVGCGSFVVLPIVAAIAIPGLLRARLAANEASAIGTVRVIGAAQERYFQRCNRYALSLQQLGPDDGLPEDLRVDTIVTKNGYQFTIESGATAELVTPASAECPDGVTEYFAHADPVTPGSTGLRHFALDERNQVVQDRQQIPNPIPDGTSLLQ